MDIDVRVSRLGVCRCAQPLCCEAEWDRNVPVIVGRDIYACAKAAVKPPDADGLEPAP